MSDLGLCLHGITGIDDDDRHIGVPGRV